MPEDLLKYGMIPEFIGRLPVITSVHNLDREALIRILTEPKNALVRQYKRLFELDGVELEFSDDALDAIADQAILRGTGARGLRAILEEVLLSVMYDVPSPQGHRQGHHHRRGRARARQPDARAARRAAAQAGAPREVGVASRRDHRPVRPSDLGSLVPWCPLRSRRVVREQNVLSPPLVLRGDVVSAVATSNASASRLRYIPALDGMRGLSLPGTILTHYALFLGSTPSAPHWLRNVGPLTLNIQMFFVLSGALITSLLVSEHQRTGAVSLKSFYLRRSRRLGPALLATVVLIGIVQYFWHGDRRAHRWRTIRCSRSVPSRSSSATGCCSASAEGLAGSVRRGRSASKSSSI